MEPCPKNLRARGSTWLALGMLFIQFSTEALAAGRQLTVAIKGLACAACAEQMVRRLESNPSVDHASYSLSSHRLSVHLRPGRALSDQRIADIVRDSGYPVVTIDRAVASTERPAPQPSFR